MRQIQIQRERETGRERETERERDREIERERERERERSARQGSRNHGSYVCGEPTWSPHVPLSHLLLVMQKTWMEAHHLLYDWLVNDDESADKPRLLQRLAALPPGPLATFAADIDFDGLLNKLRSWVVDGDASLLGPLAHFVSRLVTCTSGGQKTAIGTVYETILLRLVCLPSLPVPAPYAAEPAPPASGPLVSAAAAALPSRRAKARLFGDDAAAESELKNLCAPHGFDPTRHACLAAVTRFLEVHPALNVHRIIRWLRSQRQWLIRRGQANRDDEASLKKKKRKSSRRAAMFRGHADLELRVHELCASFSYRGDACVEAVAKLVGPVCTLAQLRTWIPEQRRLRGICPEEDTEAGDADEPLEALAARVRYRWDTLTLYHRSWLARFCEQQPPLQQQRAELNLELWMLQRRLSFLRVTTRDVIDKPVLLASWNSAHHDEDEVTARERATAVTVHTRVYTNPKTSRQHSIRVLVFHDANGHVVERLVHGQDLARVVVHGHFTSVRLFQTLQSGAVKLLTCRAASLRCRTSPFRGAQTRTMLTYSGLMQLLASKVKQMPADYVAWLQETVLPLLLLEGSSSSMADDDDDPQRDTENRDTGFECPALEQVCKPFQYSWSALLLQLPALRACCRVLTLLELEEWVLERRRRYLESSTTREQQLIQKTRARKRAESNSDSDSSHAPKRAHWSSVLAQALPPLPS